MIVPIPRADKKFIPFSGKERTMLMPHIIFILYALYLVRSESVADYRSDLARRCFRRYESRYPATFQGL